MKRVGVVGVGVCVVAIAGCGGDMATRLRNDAALRGQVTEAIASSDTLLAAMVDRAASSDASRTLLIDRTLANGAARQELMAAMATDRTMVEGILNFAVQDSGMKNHVLTLLRGMQMATP